ncbi:hypothetical protein ACVWXO_003311 [Bradyrhizobium sp. LM2.7]
MTDQAHFWSFRVLRSSQFSFQAQKLGPKTRGRLALLLRRAVTRHWNSRWALDGICAEFGFATGALSVASLTDMVATVEALHGWRGSFPV